MTESKIQIVSKFKYQNRLKKENWKLKEKKKRNRILRNFSKKSIVILNKLKESKAQEKKSKKENKITFIILKEG